MEKRIYTAGEIKIEVDKHEDKKAKEEGLCRLAGNSIPDNAGMGTGKKSYATICT